MPAEGAPKGTRLRFSTDLYVSALNIYNSWMEAVHLMKNRANAAHLVESIRELRAGKTREWAFVDG